MFTIRLFRFFLGFLALLGLGFLGVLGTQLFDTQTNAASAQTTQLPLDSSVD